MRFIFKIAFRYIFAKSNDRFISFISGFCLLGITIGVASLIVVMSIMNGFRQELTKCIIGLNGHIIVGSASPEVKEKVDSYPFVQSSSRLIEGQGLLTSDSSSSGVIVKGISLDDLQTKRQIVENIFGDLSGFKESDAILIGREIALNSGLNLGDTVKLTVAQSVSSILGSIPKSKEFKVVGIFTSGLTDYDSMNIIIPIHTAQKMFGASKTVLEVYTSNASKVAQYTKTIYRDLHKEIQFINNWQIMNGSTLNALKIEKVAMSTVLSLIIIVAAFNIISSLFMLVKDKTKDIAILRTIGASKTSIMMIFIINGLFIGICGTAIGVTIGQLIAQNINTIKIYLEKFSGIKIFDSAVYFLYNLPAKLETEDAWLVCGMSIILCFLSTIYPAYRAAKLNPVDAMRYE